MFIVILKLLGGLGLFLSVFNASIKLFGSQEALLAYAGSSRNLNVNLLTISICIIFLALASIMSKLDDKP